MWARQPPRRVMQGSGSSSHGSNRSVAAATPWPRTLHFIRWKTEQPDEALRSWRELHPTWNLTVWSEALVAQQFPDLPLESVVSNGSLRHALRFRILAEFGGIYIDEDITAIRPLDELLRHVQDSGGQAFSVCRELNQYHPNVRQRPLPPPPGVLHGRKCHRMDDAVIGAPKGDPVMMRAYVSALDNAHKSTAGRSDVATMMWTRLMRHSHELGEHPHWRVLASRTFFGIGCVCGRTVTATCEDASQQFVFAWQYFNLSTVSAWDGEGDTLSALSQLQWNNSDERTIAFHPRCLPVQASQVGAGHRMAGMDSSNIRIQILYHDKTSLEVARRFERYEWAALHKMEQSVYFESAAVLAASERESAEWSRYRYVGSVPYSILKKQSFGNENISLPALIHCSAFYGARRSQGEMKKAAGQRAGASNGTDDTEPAELIAFYDYYRADVVTTLRRAHGFEVLDVWVALLTRMGYHRQDVLNTSIPLFPTNAWMATPDFMSKYQAFAREAQMAIEDDVDLHIRMYEDAKYNGHMSPQLLAELSGGYPFYTMHAFIFERLPCFFAWISNTKVYAVSLGGSTRPDQAETGEREDDMAVYEKSSQTQRQDMEKRKFLLEGDCFRFTIGCVPNVMCSSLRAAVAEIECGNNTRYQIVDGVPRCADGISRCAKSGESEHRSFVRRSRDPVFGRPHYLVFLRDPFERLFSAFRRHKALGEMAMPCSEGPNEWVNSIVCHRLQACISRNCTFAQWVDEIEKDRATAFLNVHLKPQARILPVGDHHQIHVLRLSSRSDQKFFWNDVMKMRPKHLRASDEHESVRIHTGLEEHFKRHISMNTLDKIYNTYPEDFRAWKKSLEKGTRKEEGERTLFDFYSEERCSNWRSSKKRLPKWNQTNKRNALVILIGQQRGGELAWYSLKTNVLEQLGADLAVMFQEPFNHSATVVTMARYVWPFQKPSKWKLIYDQAERSCSNTAPIQGHTHQLLAFCGLTKSHPLLSNTQTNPLDVESTTHMLDPLCSADESGPGSSGIALALRWMVYQKLTELGLWDQYEFFVLTRTDHVHLCPHPPISLFRQQPDHIFIPGDESYGGYTDRHMAGFGKAFRTALNVTQAMVCAPKAFSNVETALAVYWLEAGLEVSEMPRTFFSVRAHDDPATWSLGTQSKALTPFNLTAKYPAEIGRARRFCDLDGHTAHDALSYMWRKIHANNDLLAVQRYPGDDEGPLKANFASKGAGGKWSKVDLLPMHTWLPCSTNGKTERQSNGHQREREGKEGTEEHAKRRQQEEKKQHEGKWRGEEERRGGGEEREEGRGAEWGEWGRYRREREEGKRRKRAKPRKARRREEKREREREGR